MPRYNEIPDVGLYLEQVTKYLEEYLAPLEDISITSSMISNYVKNGVILGPVKKQYYAEQIAHIMAIAIIKRVVSLENICQLFQMQREVYTVQVAYDYFCSELENMLYYSFGIRDNMEAIGNTQSDIKTMLRGTIIAVSYIIYLNTCFQAIQNEDEQE